MSQVLVIRPYSQQAHWLMSLRINQQKNRVASCMNKIDRLYRLSHGEDINALLTLYDWYANMKRVDYYFTKEMTRLSKLIKRKVKDTITYDYFSKDSFRLRVSSPIAATFYRLVRQFDHLMCLCETCLSFSIFKRERVAIKITAQYTRSLMQVITLISQHQQLTHYRLDELDATQHEKLIIALNADVMPQWKTETIRRIQGKLKKEVNKNDNIISV